MTQPDQSEPAGRWACHLCRQTLTGATDRCNSGVHQGPDDPNGWRGMALWTHDPPPSYEVAMAERADLTVPEFPTMPVGTTLTAMRISSDPERFVYGDAETLAWLGEQCERRLASNEEDG